MKLNELLDQKHRKKGTISLPSKINEVYGIIYRIYCIPEDKSYIGQTLSHGYVNGALCRKGMITRIRRHYNQKSLEQVVKKPLCIALSTYETNQFDVFEEEKLFGKEIALINIKEGEYMKKYNSLLPSGYNKEEVGKVSSKLLNDLSDLHDFEIKKYEYINTTRDRRRKDVTFGSYFNLKYVIPETIIKLLKTVDFEHLYLTNSNGLRIVARLRNENTNIRVYFNGTTDECLEFANKISTNIVISPSFDDKKETYKYQLKLDKVLESIEFITNINGNVYNNNSRNHKTYLLVVFGNKNGRQQTLHRVSFGGKTIGIKESYETAVEFINKLKEIMPELKYKLSNPEE